MWGPFGQRLANETASWKDGPDSRGTFKMLSTCVITFLLCVYTCIHHDIPKCGKAGLSHQLWRKALWICVGLIAPEFVRTTTIYSRISKASSTTAVAILTMLQVALVAFRQMLSARTLNQHMRGLAKHRVSQQDLETRRFSFPFLTKMLGSPPVPMDVEGIFCSHDIAANHFS